MKSTVDSRRRIVSVFSVLKTTASKFWNHNRYLVMLSILTATTLSTMARGYRRPDNYASLQWLINYDTGFTSRGLVGAVLKPLYEFKTFSEVKEIVNAISLMTLLLIVFLVLYFAKKMIAYAREGRFEEIMFLALAAFSTSAFWIMSGHTNGFFEHFLEAFTLMAVFAVYTNRYYLVPVLSIVGIAIHEIFAAYSLPVIFFAVLLQAVATKSSMLKKLLVCFLPTLIFTGFYIFFSAMPSEKKVEAVKEQVYSVNKAPTVRRNLDAVTYHLSHTLKEKWEAQRKNSFVNRLTNLQINRKMLPVVLSILALSSFILIRSGLWPFVPLALVSCFVPLLVHLIAWDAVRFAVFPIFNSFVILLSSSLFLRPVRILGTSVPYIIVRSLIIVLLAATIWNNIEGHYPLMRRYKDSTGFMSLRNMPLISIRYFRNCKKLFDNADFEKKTMHNWKVLKGEAFERNPMKSHQPKAQRNISGVQGSYYLSSKRRTDGVVTSNPFEIDGDAVAFLVGGTNDIENTYISLKIDGKTVRRATGNDDGRFFGYYWDVKKFRGKKATIVIADKAKEQSKYIMADAFCYYDFDY